MQYTVAVIKINVLYATIWCLFLDTIMRIYIFLILFIITFFITIPHAHAEQTTLWKYQCIDTMKTSRDNARRWKNDPKLDEYIEKELSAIVEMGANCVALGTPYNEEFLPYLRKWVKTARKKNLKIWYRGNFAEWEGWFDYPKGMSEEELIRRSDEFIRKNKDLFKDGDVYTAAPEAENGGPFNQVETYEHEAYRSFLVRIHEATQKTFTDINRKVEVNWLSMNGGLAKRMFDKPTLKALGSVAALDHYIKTSEEMGSYIKYFRDSFGAKVVLGEFGAPIPEINGKMTEDQQADFIESLMKELYKYHNDVVGVNYWVSYDSSTEILNEDYSPRKAAFVLKKYFKPAVVKGIVSDTHGARLEGVQISAGDGIGKTFTNKKGEYTLAVPADSMTIKYSLKDHKDSTTVVELRSGQEVVRSPKLQSTVKNPNLWERIIRFFKRT